MATRRSRVVRALNRFIELAEEREREEEHAIRTHAAFLEARFEHGADQVRRRAAALDRHTRVSVACTVGGLATIVLSASVPAVASVGSGYFLRLGILVLGIGLCRLLRR